jgi:hypothetical protein
MKIEIQGESGAIDFEFTVKYSSLSSLFKAKPSSRIPNNDHRNGFSHISLTDGNYFQPTPVSKRMSVSSDRLN